MLHVATIAALALSVPLARTVPRVARLAPARMLAESVEGVQGLLLASGATAQEITPMLLGQMGACSAL